MYIIFQKYIFFALTTLLGLYTVKKLNLDFVVNQNYNKIIKRDWFEHQ